MLLSYKKKLNQVMLMQSFPNFIGRTTRRCTENGTRRPIRRRDGCASTKEARTRNRTAGKQIFQFECVLFRHSSNWNFSNPLAFSCILLRILTSIVLSIFFSIADQLHCIHRFTYDARHTISATGNVWIHTSTPTTFTWRAHRRVRAIPYAGFQLVIIARTLGREDCTRRPSQVG